MSSVEDVKKTVCEAAKQAEEGISVAAKGIVKGAAGLADVASSSYGVALSYVDQADVSADHKRSSRFCCAHGACNWVNCLAMQSAHEARQLHNSPCTQVYVKQACTAYHDAEEAAVAGVKGELFLCSFSMFYV